MILTATLIGIIEDKIANDLSSGKTPKEHLEELKETILNHKTKLDVKIIFDSPQFDFAVNDYVSTRNFLGVDGIKDLNNFVVIIEGGDSIYIKNDNIKEIITEIVE